MNSNLHTGETILWKRRFHAFSYCEPQLAKNRPDRGLLKSNRNGKEETFSWDLSNGELKPIQAPMNNTPFIALSPDGRFIYYLFSEQGNDYGHWVRIPYEGGEIQDITPDLPLYASFAITFSQAGNLLGFTIANEEGVKVYSVGLNPDGEISERRTIYEGNGLIACPWFSYDGDVAVIATNQFSETFHFGLVALDLATRKQINALWDGPGTDLFHPILWPFSPVPGDYRTLIQSTRSGFRRPGIWNPLTGERYDFKVGRLTGDIVPLDWSPDGSKIILRQFDRAIQKLYLYDLEADTIIKLSHPEGRFGNPQFGHEGAIITQWQDAAHPSQIILIDRNQMHHPLLADGQDIHGRSWQSIRYSSSDGQEVQAWLAVPEGIGPFPALIEVHGGPQTVQANGYHPESQAWLDHGFAYLCPNYRGSTTFGSEFQNKILGDIGHWEIEDILAVRNWLVNNGIANPDQIILTGVCYGGYLTLLSLGMYPELWAGGIAIDAVADWKSIYEDTTDMAKNQTQAFFGGTPSDKPALYTERSPVAYIDRYSSPLLLIHGRNDTHTTTRQIESFVARVKSAGIPIDIIWHDLGHDSFRQLELNQQLEYLEQIFQFALNAVLKDK